ncbi:NUDIX domain-containing protein [Nakamurella sp. YIM 132087]|uniref:NUDIX domain-containing protein n=1 Tax=Nakamurella alba TaxID=2665158 RepID=A0A7K1FPL8_9ACTN|nr:NUDIX domain-containing protein [Nakamurella alba]MTD14774.1 NUDIX domain-containing protein [Nakamurella alba]
MRTSAGLLLFRRGAGKVEVLLAHPGGPFWARKDDGAWSVPKGEFVPGEEEPHAAALREFAEETGSLPDGVGPDLDLGSVRQSSAKTVLCWAREADLDPATVVSNEIELEWPPRSGRTIRVPEVDRAEWFDLDAAAVKILAGQRPFLERLAALLGTP